MRYPRPAARIGRRLEHWALAGAHRGNLMVAVSGSTAAALRAIGVPSERIRVVHNGVEEPGPLLPKAPGPLFLAMGRLVEDASFRRRQGEEARRAAEGESVDALAKALETLYRSLTRRKRIRESRDLLAERPWILGFDEIGGGQGLDPGGEPLPVQQPAHRFAREVRLVAQLLPRDPVPGDQGHRDHEHSDRQEHGRRDIACGCSDVGAQDCVSCSLCSSRPRAIRASEYRGRSWVSTYTRPR